MRLVKEIKTMDIILDKCKFKKISLSYFQQHMLYEYICCILLLTLLTVISIKTTTLDPGQNRDYSVKEAGGSGFRLYDGSDLKTYLLIRYWWDGRGMMLWLLSGPPGFTCWISCSCIQFYLLLSHYLIFISWFICSTRWCFDKLGVFHANQTSMCLDPHLN